jgi:ATP-dependent DNA helicase PIF1
MSERYHLGGRAETDTVAMAMAAARQDQAGIQRRHRLERRHGDDPSQTPPFISPVARHEISQGTEEPAPQQPLQSANPALPGNPPRRGRPLRSTRRCYCPALPASS